MTAGQGYIGNRELAISAGLMTESDARVLTYAGQAHTVFVAHRALVVVKVCMTLGSREKSKKVHGGSEKVHPYEGPASMSAWEFGIARNQTTACQSISEVLRVQFLPIPRGATFGSCPGSETSLTWSGCREHTIGKPKPIWPCFSISSRIVDQVGFFRRFEALPMM